MKKLLVIYIVLTGLMSAQTIISLDDALGIAMQNSPQIRQVELTLENRKQLLKAQNAALKSNFSLSVNPYSTSYFRQFDRRTNLWYTSENTSSSADFQIRQPILWTDGVFSVINELQWLEGKSDQSQAKNEPWSNNLYLRYDQPIFTHNQTKLQLSRLELNLENTMINYVLQKLNLEYSVTNNFFQIYGSKLAYDISREQYANTKTSYEIIKNQVDAGISAKEELYQAEYDLLDSEASVQTNLVNLENALDQFKILIGVPIADSIDIIGDVSHITVDVNLDTAITHALKNRLELRQREIDVQVAYQSLVETMAQNEFRGNISLTYGLQGVNETYDTIYDEPDLNRRASISFEIPLFDWGERKARIKADEANIESSKLSKEEQQDDIIINIRQAYRELRNLVTQIKIATQNIKNAELTYEISLENFKNGDLKAMELSQRQTQLSNAKIQLTNSIINYKLALLNLKILSMYDFVRNEPVIPDDLLQDAE
jgi:outer membrane protein TolC